LIYDTFNKVIIKAQWPPTEEHD